MDSDPIVLNYYESLLRRSDVNLLEGPSWLNDNIISFYFEYLAHQYCTILFVSPEVTQCIKITPIEQIGIFLEPLNFDTKRHVLFALNDNETINAGGTHWSLLVFSRDERTVYHYDSMGNSVQTDQAYNFAKKLFLYSGLQGQFQEKSCIRQENGHDCGIHLICNAEYLAAWLKEHGECARCNLANSLLASKIHRKRHEILNLINELR